MPSASSRPSRSKRQETNVNKERGINRRASYLDIMGGRQIKEQTRTDSPSFSEVTLAVSRWLARVCCASIMARYLFRGSAPHAWMHARHLCWSLRMVWHGMSWSGMGRYGMAAKIEKIQPEHESAIRSGFWLDLLDFGCQIVCLFVCWLSLTFS